MCPSVCPSVCDCRSPFVWSCHWLRLSVYVSVSAASVRLSLWVSAPPPQVFPSCHYVSVRLSASGTGVRPGPPGSLGLASEGGRGRGGGSPGRRGGAGAETVGGGGGGGGRGRRAARRGCVRGAGGGGCQSRLSQRRGTSAASSSRRGPARPGSAASGESPAPAGTLPRPAAHSASGKMCAPGGIQAPQAGRPPRPRACPATPPAAPHSSLTLPSPPHTYGRPRGSRHPGGPAAASALEFLGGPPSAPSPARPQVWGHWKTPPPWGGTRAAHVAGAGLTTPPHPDPATPAPLRSAQPKPPPRPRRPPPTGTPSLFGERGGSAEAPSYN